ncbi:MAG: ABC transporter substrate-binding protein, partial [Bdellovibrionales bacterium]|nr:ABC transporter substrate-binding protein [Bdellovibrionales bacterium]
LVDDTRIQASDGTLKGTMYITYPEASSEFQKRYMQRYGEAAGVAADTAYDVVHLYAKAMERSKTTDPQVVAQAMHDLRVTGASGEIVFDVHGGVVREPIVQVVD